MKMIATRFLAAIILIFCCLSTYAASQYTILIDAGSSASRMHLFKHDATEIFPKIQKISSKEIKPGLSSFAKAPKKAAKSLKPLLDEANQILNNQSVNPKMVKIHLLASGGMRRIEEKQQEKIYAQVKHYIKTHYHFTIGDIKTIDGKEEGLYGWLSINYLTGTFQKKSKTFGSIDVGGASTQIAFETQDKTLSKDKAYLVINQKPYWVFSKSFLNLGQDQARETMKKHLGAIYCYPKGHIISPNQVGFFKMNKCRTIYSDILQKQAVKQQVAPQISMPFIAYSAVYYVHDFFKINSKQSLKQKIKTLCNKNWENWQKEHPNDPYLSNYCANGTYIHELLYNTYQLQEKHVKVLNKIQDQEINWTLGALLHRLIEHS